MDTNQTPDEIWRIFADVTDPKAWQLVELSGPKFSRTRFEKGERRRQLTTSGPKARRKTVSLSPEVSALFEKFMQEKEPVLRKNGEPLGTQFTILGANKENTDWTIYITP